MQKFIVYFFLILLLLSCGSSDSSEDKSAELKKFASQYEEGSEKLLTVSPRDKDREKSIKVPFTGEFEPAYGRYLEYSASITGVTEDLSSSRLLLLDLIQEHGFIKRVSTNVSGEKPVLHAEFYVKADEFTSALKKLQKIALIKSEEIKTEDYTPKIKRNEISIDREFSRVSRKERSRNRVKTSSENWKDIEASLEKSEDRIDQVKYEKWLVNDKVSWAKVNFSLTGPYEKINFEIPEYKNALYSIVQFFLNLGYVVLLLIPLWIVIVFIYLKRKKFSEIFLSKIKK